MPDIKITNLYKKFDKNRQVIENLNLSMKQGEILSILGPNGCGKSTLLNVISGLIACDKGEIKGVEKNETGIIFQNYGDFLLPWKNVLDNLTLPLEIRGITKNERLKIAENLLKEFSLKLPLRSYPYQLSGGQKQLLSLTRCLIKNNKLLLLDEPFSNLDYKIKAKAIDFIIKYWRKNKPSIVFVTHNLEDAIFLGQRIIILKEMPLNNTSLEFNINLDYPREFNSKNFGEIHARIMENLHGFPVTENNISRHRLLKETP